MIHPPMRMSVSRCSVSSAPIEPAPAPTGTSTAASPARKMRVRPTRALIDENAYAKNAGSSSAEHGLSRERTPAARAPNSPMVAI